jgi:hypothetical protein
VTAFPLQLAAGAGDRVVPDRGLAGKAAGYGFEKPRPPGGPQWMGGGHHNFKLSVGQGQQGARERRGLHPIKALGSNRAETRIGVSGAPIPAGVGAGGVFVASPARGIWDSVPWLFGSRRHVVRGPNRFHLSRKRRTRSVGVIGLPKDGRAARAAHLRSFPLSLRHLRRN